MDEKIVSELEVILSEYQLLNIRLANIIEQIRQEQSEAIEKPKGKTLYPESEG